MRVDDFWTGAKHSQQTLVRRRVHRGHLTPSLTPELTGGEVLTAPAPLIIQVSKTYGCRSDTQDKITESIIDLTPRVSWSQVPGIVYAKVLQGRVRPIFEPLIMDEQFSFLLVLEHEMSSLTLQRCWRVLGGSLPNPF